METNPGTPRRVAASQPREIGGYEIVAPLGRGGMGVVYRARDPHTGHGVAVKTVLWAGEGALAAIRREIIALSGIRHPGVVKILGEGVLEGRPWYAMELIEGRSLRQRLAELWQPAATSHTTIDVKLVTSSPPSPASALPPSTNRRGHDTIPAPFAGAPGAKLAAPAELREMLELVAAMCEPLAHVHAAGIVHRDLTPDNVIVRSDGAPVLVDFGLASSFRRGGREALAVAGTIVGTCHYMAPEQIRGEVVDARADLYSLGCILYEALTGRPPFLGASPAGILSMHLYDTPMPPSAREEVVPLWLDSLVLALLAKDPRDRIGYAGDVAALIGRALGTPATADAPAYIYRPRMVGRGDEVARFNETIEQLRAGHGGVVMVRGVSGVGKTRLAVELATRASSEGMRVVTAECPPSTGVIGRPQSRAAPLAPLKPFLQAIADRCLEHGVHETERLLGERGRVLATYEPALGRLPGVADAPAPAALTVEGTRARLFQYLRETLAVAAAEPLVLLVDDIQWADELTLRFLLSLRADFFAHAPLMILATQRSEEDHPLVAELARGPSTDVIDLLRLDGEGVRAMVSDMLALPEVPAALVESLVGQSDGVPFHVGEYLRAAVEDGILTRRPGSVWSVAAAAAAAPLPTSLAELLRHRLDRLGAGGRTLAALAAVLGREFDAELLADLTGAPADVIDDAVRDMVRRHIFEEASEGKLRFGHDKIREAAYDDLGADARRQAHFKAARALEHRASSQPSHDLYPVLAHHWSMADEPSKAVEFLEKAGERALEVGGYQDTVDFLRRALVLAERGGAVDPRRRGRWHRWLGEASWGLGDVDGCGDHFAAALAGLDAPLPTTTRGWLADAGRRIAGQLFGRTPIAGDPDAAEAALAASRLTYRYYHAGENLSMVAMTLRAVDLADRAELTAKVAHPYQQLGYLAGLFRFPRVAERYFARSHQRALDTSDPANVGVTLYSKGAYLCGAERLGEAQRICDEAVRLLREIDNPQELECALAVLVHVEHCLGRYRDAVAHAQELYESARARNNVMHEAWGAYTMARELLALGMLDDAVALLAHAEPLASGAGDRASLVILVGLRALAETRRGEHAAARATIDCWIDMTRGSTPTVYSLGHGYAAVAEAALDVCEATGSSPTDLARARATVAHAWRYAALFPVGRATAFVLEARGQRLRGRHRLAALLARNALDRATGAPLPYEAALAHRELAWVDSRDGVDHGAEAAAILARLR